LIIDQGGLYVRNSPQERDHRAGAGSDELLRFVIYSFSKVHITRISNKKKGKPACVVRLLAFLKGELQWAKEHTAFGDMLLV
jgi:hypothetical protein